MSNRTLSPPRRPSPVGPPDAGTDTGTSRPPFTRAMRRARLPRLLAERILVLDGAMGTMLQARAFDEAGHRGERFR